MVIVQINAVYEYSSTGRIVKELHQALKNAGHDSFVFCTNAEDEENGVFCMGTKITRKVHGLMSRITGLQGYFSHSATKKLIHKLDKIQPDAVHLHNLHGNYIHVNMLLDYLVEKQIPTLVTLHDCWLFTGHCCHYLDVKCDKWQYGCGNCPSIHKWNKSWIFDTSAKMWKDKKERFGKLNSLTVIGVSDWITNECRKSFMKEYARFERIYNWIDLNTFKPAQERRHNEAPIILSVSQSWSEIKGLYDILSIAAQYPTYHFVLIGEKPSVSVPDNVEMVGTISDIAQLVSWYQKADVLLHLSYQETFGKVIAEALACGTPAVVYDVTAMPELIGPGCGFTVKKGDWRAAGEAIEKIICDTEWDNKTRPFAEHHFDMSKLIDDWMRLYRTAANEKDKDGV